MQGSLGLGMLLGPVISTIVYAPFNYWGTFFFYGCSILVFGVGAACLLPARLNKDGASRTEKLERHEQHNTEAEARAAEATATADETAL